MGIIIIILANLVSMIGVIFWEWGTVSVIVLFWIETLFIGFFAVLSIGLAQVKPEDEFFSKWRLIPFFMLSYGLFAGLQGILMLLFVVNNTREIFTQGFSISIIGVFLGRLIAFLMQYIVSKRYKESNPAHLLFAPYCRLFMQEFMALACFYVGIKFFNLEYLFLIFVIVCKATADALIYLSENKK
jgi:hypothetical protein